MVRVVDVHAHAVVPRAQLLLGRQVPAGGPLVDLDARLAAMAAAGVDVQVVRPAPVPHQPPAGAGPAAGVVAAVNDGIAELVRRAPDRLVGVATVALHDPDRAAEQLRRAVDDYDFRGVQICESAAFPGPSGPDLDPFWSVAEALGVVVFVHPENCAGDFSGAPAPAGPPRVDDGVLDRFRRLVVCLHHAGGHAPAVLARPRGARLYLDLPVGRRGGTRRLPDGVDPGRVLWGSGYPFAAYAPGLQDILAAMPGADAEAIAGRTARALLRLPGPAPPDPSSTPDVHPDVHPRRPPRPDPDHPARSPRP